jgi:hypothetical protein
MGTFISEVTSMSIQDDLREENAEIEADEHARDKEDNEFADEAAVPALNITDDSIRALGAVITAYAAHRPRAPRRTAAEREQAAIAKAESKLESLRAKERLRRLREAHGHVDQAMVYLQGGDAIVRMAAGGGCENFDIRDVLIDIRAALREEIGE